MKSYTDLNQSRKLAEILPLESADMCFNTRNNMPPLMTPYSRFNEFYDMEPTPAFLIPCWSLAALLDMLDSQAGLGKDYDLWICYDNRKSHITKHYEHAIDAVFNMICWLKENRKL